VEPLAKLLVRCFGLSPGIYRRHAAASGSSDAAPSPLARTPLYPSDFGDGLTASSRRNRGWPRRR